VEADLFIEVGKMLVVARRMLRRAPEVLTEDDVQWWFMVLSRAGVDARDLEPALARYMESNEWFPAPSQIIERARTVATERAVAEMRARPRLPEPVKEPKTIDDEIADAVSLQQSRENALKRLALWDEKRESERTVIIAGEPTPLRDLMSAILGNDIHERVAQNSTSNEVIDE
jgi:hypothetical protein